MLTVNTWKPLSSNGDVMSIDRIIIDKVNYLVQEFVERAWKCIFSNDKIINLDSLLSSAHTYLKSAEKVIETFPGIKNYLPRDVIEKLSKLASLDVRETRFYNIKDIDINIINKKLDKIRRTSKWILNKLR